MPRHAHLATLLVDAERPFDPHSSFMDADPESGIAGSKRDPLSITCPSDVLRCQWLSCGSPCGSLRATTRPLLLLAVLGRDGRVGTQVGTITFARRAIAAGTSRWPHEMACGPLLMIGERGPIITGQRRPLIKRSRHVC